ncbi:hypothetical protein Bbelb_408190 [Branchiostoma belcheri]|nr:hypothetical protein Bbelb_408190 [Branchiostoma belcheri]
MDGERYNNTAELRRGNGAVSAHGVPLMCLSATQNFEVVEVGTSDQRENICAEHVKGPARHRVPRRVEGGGVVHGARTEAADLPVTEPCRTATVTGRARCPQGASNAPASRSL